MKKIFFWSFISIPIAMIILLLSLYFTNLWKPTVVAIIVSSILLIIVGIFAYFYFRNSYLNFEKDNSGEFQYNIKQKFWKLGLIGFIADFCDTIGIGSFAISIVLLKLTKQVKNDKQLLGTLNVGHAIPTCLQAIIFISLVKVEWLTLVLLITAAAIGAYIGALIANKIKLGWAQILLGVALIIISIIILLGQKEVSVMPRAGTSDSLEVWWKYLLGAIIFFGLGILQSLGIGIYAPAMAVTYLMGLSSLCAFPIMMGSAAFLMPVGAFRFIKDQNYDIKIATSFTLGGSFGVIVSYLIVFVGIQNGLGLDKANFINVLNWIIIVVIWYTAGMMFYNYYQQHKKSIHHS
ncbi:TSUP family transporter [Spiroplasma melliferum]|uniref:TSUP family transporter n=2 Tax=Spiroplasma melliferum TaxID=2134 RepID=UPI0002A64B04|nr:TSUP family transporter [Spiroplasma melliferum]ELL44637.1 hypothetical protein SMIPMB4A_v3c4150 [Spiroplasma melliferum IPMB4A]